MLNGHISSQHKHKSDCVSVNMKDRLLIWFHIVDLRAASYFTAISKLGLLGNSGELQFGTSKQWRNHRQVQRTKERGSLLLGFRTKLGEVVLDERSMESMNLRLQWFLIGCKWRLVHSCQGRQGSASIFSKADEIPM